MNRELTQMKKNKQKTTSYPFPGDTHAESHAMKEKQQLSTQLHFI